MTSQINQVKKIVNEPLKSGYVEWLHKIDQFERIKKILVVDKQ